MAAVSRTIIVGIWVAFFQRVPAILVRTGAPSEVLLCKRKTMKVDIFALGVLAYFVLSKGSHPFGNRFKRNGNIVDGVFELDKVKHLPDAYHLIASMINYDPDKRPTAVQVLSHPFFWSTEKKIQALGETLARADDEPAEAERLAGLEVIGGQQWRRRVSGRLIGTPLSSDADCAWSSASSSCRLLRLSSARLSCANVACACVWCAAHLEATQPMPPGATTSEGGAWAYDDTSLIHLLRVIR